MLASLIRTIRGHTPARVKAAAERGDVAFLQGVLAAGGVDLLRGAPGNEELTPLHWAAAANRLPVISFLLSSSVGCDPNVIRNNAFTPLHAAAMKGNDAVCETLLAAGASVNAQTEPQKYTPLHSAAFIGHIATLKVLLAGGADRTILNYRNERPSDTAERQGHASAAALLASGT